MQDDAIKNGVLEKTCALVLNGDIGNVFISEDFILAADGGADKLAERGIVPDAVIGDMDSVSKMPASVEVIRYPTEKDMTDGELGLRYLIDKGFKKINVYGAEGGRLDHVLQNLNMLRVALSAGVCARVRCADYDIELIDGEFFKKLPLGSTLSILPYDAEIFVESTRGLKYPLNAQFLQKDSSRGLSNTVAENEVFIKIGKGCAFVVTHALKN